MSISSTRLAAIGVAKALSVEVHSAFDFSFESLTRLVNHPLLRDVPKCRDLVLQVLIIISLSGRLVASCQRRPSLRDIAAGPKSNQIRPCLFCRTDGGCPYSVCCERDSRTGAWARELAAAI